MVVLECAIGRFPYIQSEDQESGPSFYELLEAIMERPPPSAPSDQFSPEFCSFVSSWYLFVSLFHCQLYYNIYIYSKCFKCLTLA